MTLVFDSIANDYDQWFDSPEGGAVYETELACLQSLNEDFSGRWLEVGVGTGRFASRLGISEGVDPSPNMLKLAAQRKIRIYEGQAENLPFPDGCFDGVLIALALCFIPDQEKAIQECHRILRTDGRLLIGDIMADSPWGQLYEKEGASGDPVWSRASFFSGSELGKFIEKIGFQQLKASSSLFWKPTESPEAAPRLEAGIIPNAGFLGLLFSKTG